MAKKKEKKNVLVKLKNLLGSKMQKIVQQRYIRKFGEKEGKRMYKMMKDKKTPASKAWAK